MLARSEWLYYPPSQYKSISPLPLPGTSRRAPRGVARGAHVRAARRVPPPGSALRRRRPRYILSKGARARFEKERGVEIWADHPLSVTHGGLPQVPTTLVACASQNRGSTRARPLTTHQHGMDKII